jgi:hypothetical protein
VASSAAAFMFAAVRPMRGTLGWLRTNVFGRVDSIERASTFGDD